MKKTVLAQGLVAAAVAALLVACGGGGGAPYQNNGNGGTGGGAAPGTTPTATPTPTNTPTPVVGLSVMNAAGAQTQRLSAAENATARVSIVDGNGVPMSNVAVNFSSGNDVVKFGSNGVLTDSSGVASIDFSAASPTYAGVAKIAAWPDVEGLPSDFSKMISVQFSSQPAVPVDPVTLANSIEVGGIVPTDKSIVIKSAGSAGRTETAQVRFRVLDKDGAPVKDVPVKFAASKTGVVDINIPTAKTNADGYVLTTVSSKQATDSVIIIAEVVGKPNIKTQSDRLVVTTGVAAQKTFDLSASKYNLDGLFSGDPTTIRAAISDAKGNPVADGVAVVFTANAGAVGSSDMGACKTTNGVCTVDFRVQRPYTESGISTITAVANTNETGETSLSQTIDINMSGTSLNAAGDPRTLLPVITGTTVFSVGNTCKGVATITLENGNGRAVPAGTTITGASINGRPIKVTPTRGNPVADSLSFAPTQVTLDLETWDIATGCDNINNSANTASDTATVGIDIQYPASKTVTTRNITVNYVRQP